MGPHDLPAPPYPESTAVNGFDFRLDYRRIEQSDTWSLATPALRPWLLMIWYRSWQQIPAGAFVDQDDVIAARIGMALVMFKRSRPILLRGWRLHADGRIYHPVIVERVQERLAWRSNENARKQAYRQKMSHGTDAGQTRDTSVRDDAGAAAAATATSKAKTRRTREPAAPVALPDWLPEDSWKRWKRHRGPKLTAEAARLQILTLDELRKAGHDPVTIIDHAIECGWAKFYAPKDKAVNSSRYAAHDKRADMAAAMQRHKASEIPDEPKAIPAEFTRVA